MQAGEFTKSLTSILAWIASKYRFGKKISVRGLAKYGRDSFFVDPYWSKFLVSRKNALDQLLITQGAIDEGLPYVLNKICEPNSIAIDIGANAGYYSVPFAQHFKEVHAYEPNPFVYAKLKKNAQLNNFDNLTLYEIAVGEKVTFADLFIQDSIDGDWNLNAGLSSLKSRPQFHRETLVVPVVNIDSLNLNTTIGLIKIDVEGTEYEVLLGAILTIKQDNPVIVWEASISISKENFLSCVSILSDMNYQHFEILSGLKLREYVHSGEYPSYDFNMLSMPRNMGTIHAIQTKIDGMRLSKE